MDANEVKKDMKVRIANLGDTDGMNVRSPYLEVRKVGKVGVVGALVPGRDDLWWIGHASGEIGAYRPSELEKISDPIANEETHAS